MEPERMHVIAGAASAIGLVCAGYCLPRRKVRHLNNAAIVGVSGLAIMAALVGDADVKPDALVLAHANANAENEAADDAGKEGEPRTSWCVVPPFDTTRQCVVPPTNVTSVCRVPAA